MLVIAGHRLRPARARDDDARALRGTFAQLLGFLPAHEYLPAKQGFVARVELRNGARLKRTSRVHVAAAPVSKMKTESTLQSEGKMVGAIGIEPMTSPV
jgi:hypothetical protein